MRRPPPLPMKLRDALPPPASEQASLPAVLDALTRELTGGKYEATVFGSRLRGEAHAGSDIDILLHGTGKEGFWETQNKISDLCFEFGMKAEIVATKYADPAFVERIQTVGIRIGTNGTVPRLPDPWPPVLGDWVKGEVPGWLARPLGYAAENMLRAASLVDLALEIKSAEANSYYDEIALFQALCEAGEGIARGLNRVLAALGEGKSDAPFEGELGIVSAATRPFISYNLSEARIRHTFAPRLRGSLLSLADATWTARGSMSDARRAMSADLMLDTACLTGNTLPEAFSVWLHALGAPPGFPEKICQAAVKAVRNLNIP